MTYRRHCRSRRRCGYSPPPRTTSGASRQSQPRNSRHPIPWPLRRPYLPTEPPQHFRRAGEPVSRHNADVVTDIDNDNHFKYKIASLKSATGSASIAPGRTRTPDDYTDDGSYGVYLAFICSDRMALWLGLRVHFAPYAAVIRVILTCCQRCVTVIIEASSHHRRSGCRVTQGVRSICGT